MGSAKDVMELFAERDIRRIFSTSDGWSIMPVGAPSSTGYFYRVSRSKWAGEELAFIAVSFEKSPGEDVINALDLLPKSQGFRTKKYLLTPQAADTSAVPPHVKLLLMNAFTFDGGQVIWLTKKKNARKFSTEQAIAA
ncbi:hypothetical protein [Methanoregula sp.]|uniref:hypothetical protein n=1 Tax=Methanoregula sp. TaxID=2052170 RepID=UPI00356B3CB5